MEQSLFGSSEAASQGGKARAKSLSQERRREISQIAAASRWAGTAGQGSIRVAAYMGSLKFSDLEIPCAVLSDGTRVISERGLLAGLGIKYGGALSVASQGKDGAAKLPMFVGYNNLRPFIDMELAALLQQPIRYRAIVGGNPAHGLKAELLPKVCDVWLKARDAGVLTSRQHITAVKADIVVRGLAEVGIIALVDEATGFQDVRSRDALAKILEAFVAKELRKWVRTFPPDYYKELFRLRGLDYPPDKNPPQYIGALTNNIVYDRLAPGVLAELRAKNPANDRGNRSAKHHQWLTADIGHPKLMQHLSAVVALMRVSKEYDHFKSLLDMALPRYKDAALFLQSSEDSKKK